MEPWATLTLPVFNLQSLKVALFEARACVPSVTWLLRHPMNQKTPKPTQSADETSQVSASRRKALLRLGLAVGAAYAAPTLLRLDRSAEAMGVSCVKNPKFC
jgi:hypothetical protein